MRKDQHSGTTDTNPVTGGADRIDATVSTKNHQEISNLPCDRIRPDMKHVGGLAGCILLLLLTCSSVSAYQMSAQVLGIIIASSFSLFAYLIIVAVRCRHRQDTSSQDQ